MAQHLNCVSKVCSSNTETVLLMKSLATAQRSVGHFQLPHRQQISRLQLHVNRALAVSSCGAQCHTPLVPAEGPGAPSESLSAQPEAQVPGVLRPDIGQHLQQSGLDTNSAAYRAAVRIQSRFRGFAVRKVRVVL